MSAFTRSLLDQLAVARRVVAGYAAAPEQIGRFLLRRRKRYLGDTIAGYDRQLEDALPPQVAACLAVFRGCDLAVIVEGIGTVSGSSAADFVVRLYRAGIAELRRRAGGQSPAAEPSVPEMIAAIPLIEPVLDAWRRAAVHWAPLADQEFKQAIAVEQGTALRVPTGSGRKVTPAKRALSAYMARFAHQRVGVRTLARLASFDTRFHTLLLEAGGDPADEPATRRVLEAALRWARKHLTVDGEPGQSVSALCLPRITVADTPNEGGRELGDNVEPERIATPCLLP